MMDFPSSLIFLKTLNSLCISEGVKTAVGSSRINISAPRYNTLIISKVCFSETDMSYTFLFRSMMNPYLSHIC